jgi:phosphoglycerate dehydrogenase-like enzyme
VELWIPDQAGRESLGPLPEVVQLRLFPRDGPPPQDIVGAEFLVPSHVTRGLRALLGDMTRLRVIQTLSAGVDWLLPARPRGVTLCDARGARDAAVSEWVLATVLAMTKRLPELRDRQGEHCWQAIEPGDLAGRRVMILGYGSIGAAVERRLEPFDVEVIRVARRRRPGVQPVDEAAGLLGETDVLVILVPFTRETEGLVGGELLELLPQGALVVNASRGRVVDQEALLELARAGRLRAALDVVDPEPLPPEHPLWDVPGVLITPHLAGDSPAASRAAFALVGDQVRRYVRGEALLNVVQEAY